MKERSLLAVLFAVVGLGAQAQCSVSLPVDTVNIYWGYQPLACATLPPTISGAQPNTITWSNGLNTPSISVCDSVSSWYFVNLQDITLCTATDSVFVNVVDVHCGNNGNKVAVCHIPPGNPTNAHTICISENGVPAHLAHGCVLGPCAVPVGPMGPVTGTIQMSVTPNPVNEVTQVAVTSLVAQHVQMTVIDATGRRLSVLLDADMNADEQRTVVLNSAQLPMGTTLFWLEAKSNSDVQLQRVVLVR